jgi:hypothetical protein
MDRWLTYAAAGELLGMTPEAVRQRARRQRWRTQPGNDGKTLILLPDGEVVRPRVRPPERTPGQPADQSGEVDALRELVGELRRNLEAAETRAAEAQRELAEAQTALAERTGELHGLRRGLETVERLANARHREALEATQKAAAAAEQAAQAEAKATETGAALERLRGRGLLARLFNWG